MKIVAATLVLLFFTAASFACEIPFGWRIIAPDHCKVMEEVHNGLRELDKNCWMWALTRGQQHTRVFAEKLSQLTIWEAEDAFPCGVDTSTGEQQYCLGSYSKPFWTIRFSRRHEQEYHVLYHELGHFVWDRLGLSSADHGTFQDIGHGSNPSYSTGKDPWVITINTWLRQFYKTTVHPYHPGLFSRKGIKLVSNGEGCRLVANLESIAR